MTTGRLTIKTLSPILELNKLQEDINHLLGELSNHFSGGGIHDSSAWIPNVDLSEDHRQVQVKIEVPGVTREHLQVLVQDSYLRVQGEKKPPVHNTRAHYLCLERSYGRFSRIIHLNSVVDIDAASARLHNGILTIILPKLSNRRCTEKSIPIE
jgi:HSP20 family protein